MTQAPQEISITYGSFTIDTTNKANYLILDNAWGIQYRDTSATVSFKVLVIGTSESDYFSKESAFREAFRDIRKILTISLSGSTYYSWTVSGNPHADSVPKVSLLNDEHFTNRTGAFSVEIEVVMAAITSRRSENVVIAKDASSIRTMTITATYNATSSLGAYQSYQADFDTFCASVISFIDAREGSATWEEVTNPNLNTNTVVNNIVTITRIYKELVFSQSESTLNDTELVDMTFTIDFSVNQPGDTIPSQAPDAKILNRIAKRPTEVFVQVKANVPKTQTDLESVFTNKIRPYIINHARDRGGFALMAVTTPKVNYDRVNNIITATFSMIGSVEGTGQVLSSSVSVNEKNDFGNLLVGAHDGTKFGRYVVPIKATRTRTITEDIVSISSGSVGGGTSGGGSGGGSSVGIFGSNGGGLFGGGNPFGGGIGLYDAGSQPGLSFGVGDPDGLSGSSIGGVLFDAGGDSFFGEGGGVGESGTGGGAPSSANIPPPFDGWVLMTDDSTASPKVLGTIDTGGENFSVIQVTYIHTYAWVTTPVQGTSGGGGRQSVISARDR